MAMGVVSFLRGVLTYLLLFLFPTDLYFDRARRVFVSPHEFGFIATLAIYAGIGVLIWRKWRALTPLARFCLVWFWIELLPVSQIVTSIGVYPGAISVAEHFVYMACIPAFILLALGLEQGIAWLKARRLVSTLILALAGVGMTVFLLVMLLGRATCASSEFAMLHESLAHDPHNSRLQYSLGRLFADTGYKDLAVEAFRRSVKLHNCNPNYHMALGVALADRGDNLEAVRIWEAMPARDDISKAILDRKKSAYAALVKEYEAKHAAAPNDPQVLFALGVFQAKLGDQDKALASFEAAWAADSTRFDALFNVAVTAEGLGNWPKARTAYTELAARAAVDNAFHRMAVERLSRPEPVQKN